VTILNLNRLSKRERAEMMIHVGGGKTLPKEIADQIVDRTDGVPLFIEEPLLTFEKKYKTPDFIGQLATH